VYVLSYHQRFTRAAETQATRSTTGELSDVTTHFHVTTTFNPSFSFPQFQYYEYCVHQSIIPNSGLPCWPSMEHVCARCARLGLGSKSTGPSTALVSGARAFSTSRTSYDEGMHNLASGELQQR
jgi:hypothetical protein